MDNNLSIVFIALSFGQSISLNFYNPQHSF